MKHRSVERSGAFGLFKARAVDPKTGALALKNQLTIVLPLHNQERQIRSIVTDVLDLAVQLHVDMRLVVVDDGSLDDTYESACELASRFPQVLALRQPSRRGLAAVADLVRKRIDVDLIIMHDGISPICMSELRELILEEHDLSLTEVSDCSSSQTTRNTTVSRQFGAIRTLHESLERAHRRLTGFSWLKLHQQPVVPRRRQVIEQPLATTAEYPLAVATTFLPNLGEGSITPTSL